MRLVTYQLLNTQELNTGIQISKDEILDIAAEARARNAAQKVATMLDIIQAGARSVDVPFSGGGETEQGLRARAFEDLGLTTMVAEDDLTPQRLASAIDLAAHRPPASQDRVDLLGAKRSAELLGRWMSEIEW